jgi:hypothetical protein
MILSDRMRITDTDTMAWARQKLKSQHFLNLASSHKLTDLKVFGMKWSRVF